MMELIALHPDLIVCERGSDWSETNDEMKHGEGELGKNSLLQNAFRSLLCLINQHQSLQLNVIKT